MESVQVGQKMWFEDKDTGEKVVVEAEKVEHGKITFSYKGNTHTFPEKLLGERIFICVSDKAGKKTAASAKELFYQGEFFTFDGGKWIAIDGTVPKDGYQKRLSDICQKRQSHYMHSVKELVAYAQKQVNDIDGTNIAIRSYEIAMVHANWGEAKGFIATLSSLYRKTGRSNAATALYDFAVERYGYRIESAPFLTSVAAAFMDIGDISTAERLKNKSFALAGGVDSAELSAFNQRFSAETRTE